MNKETVLVHVAAVLSTLYKLEGYWSPRTPIYMALGCDYQYFLKLESLLVASKLVTVTSEKITLTSLGITKAQELEKVGL